MSKMISIIFLALALALSLSLQGAFGKFACEELPVAMCSFAIASSGNRCLLETEDSTRGSLYCKTSKAISNVMNEYIESDSCINACGVDRKSVGISSDNLLDSRFTTSLCSSPCLNNCPNIADLYHNLALGEGMHLPDLCARVLKAATRRAFNEQNLAAEPEPDASPESLLFNEAIESEEVMSDDDDDDNDAAAANAPVSVEEEFAEAPAPSADDDAAARELLSALSLAAEPV